MLDFRRPGSPARAPAPRFSLDAAERERSRAGRSGRSRLLHVLLLLGIMVVSGVLLVRFVDALRPALPTHLGTVAHDAHLQPMPAPSLDGLPPLPAASPALVDGEHPPAWSGQPSAALRAWWDQMARADDRQPPLPQRALASDLLLHRLVPGAPVLFSGLLIDDQPAAADGARRLLLALDDQQYAEILAPASSADATIGHRVQGVGRYVGDGRLPVAQPAVGAARPDVTVPVIAARALADAALAAGQPAVDPYQMQGHWHLPAHAFRDVDDDLLLLETRSYYLMLGQVHQDLIDGAYRVPPPSANQVANAIHANPAAYRGEPFTITGHVVTAWEDPTVEHDHPYGVQRVVRIILWSEDLGPYDQLVNGQVVTSRKLVTRALEFAAITDQPLPAPGSEVRAMGRFLRLRAMLVPTSPQAAASGDAMPRQSDRSYTFLFVTGPTTLVPPPVEETHVVADLVVMLVIIAVGIGALLIARRDARSAARVQSTVRAMRASRQALARGGPSAPGPAADRQPEGSGGS